METEKENSIDNCLKVAQENADKINATECKLVMECNKEKGIMLWRLPDMSKKPIINFNAGDKKATLYTFDPSLWEKLMC